RAARSSRSSWSPSAARSPSSPHSASRSSISLSESASARRSRMLWRLVRRAELLGWAMVSFRSDRYAVRRAAPSVSPVNARRERFLPAPALDFPAMDEQQDHYFTARPASAAELRQVP